MKASAKVISYVCQLQGWVLMTVCWVAITLQDNATIEQKLTIGGLMVVALLSFAVSIYADAGPQRGRRYE